MKKNAVVFRFICAGCALWLAMIACSLINTSTAGDLRTESQSVELGTASAAQVEIEFPAGELKVTSGASSLMQASFRYNVADWQPRLGYTLNEARGELLISTEKDALPVGGGLVNQWDVQLSGDVPLDLLVHTSAGDSNLDLGNLNLMSATIETGAGVTTVHLNGAWQHDVVVSIEGGVGEITVNLPAEMGVRVDMDTALVSVTANGLTRAENGYINKAYGVAPYTLTLRLQAGVGSVVLVAP
jgi:hypothetical protein